jgi:tetratricopeptide (TPR) repeat protein
MALFDRINPIIIVSEDRLPFDETYLRERLGGNPNEWETRIRLADGLYEKEAYAEAAEVIWSAKYIPSNDLDIALAIHILGKAQPRKAIRLLSAVLEYNRGNPSHNMAMANAMLHFGMILQAIRFYGAALEVDPTLVNPDIEYFILWSDDKSTMRGMFEKNLNKIGQISRKIRGPKEELNLNSRMSMYSAPICLTDLLPTPGEEFKHEFYEQATPLNIAPPTPISKSSVPTSVLHVKWSTVAKPAEDAPIPVAAPPVAPPFAPAPEEPPTPGPRKLNIPGR